MHPSHRVRGRPHRALRNGATADPSAPRPCGPGEESANMCSMVVCVLLPRFELEVAVGGRAALAQGAAALAPEPGREQLVGEVSQAAEGFGVHPGMRLGEALARCPPLALVPPDPVAVADDWERGVSALEAIGAAGGEGGPPPPASPPPRAAP